MPDDRFERGRDMSVRPMDYKAPIEDKAVGDLIAELANLQSSVVRLKEGGLANRMTDFDSEKLNIAVENLRLANVQLERVIGDIR